MQLKIKGFVVYKRVKPDCCDINKCCIHAKAVIGLCKVKVVGVLLWQRCIYACRSMQSVGVGQFVMMFFAFLSILCFCVCSNMK